MSERAHSWLLVDPQIQCALEADVRMVETSKKKTYFGMGKLAGAANEGEPRGPQPWSAEQEQLASLAEGHLSARPASLWLTELRWPIQESGLHGS